MIDEEVRLKLSYKSFFIKSSCKITETNKRYIKRTEIQSFIQTFVRVLRRRYSKILFIFYSSNELRNTYHAEIIQRLAAFDMLNRHKQPSCQEQAAQRITSPNC